MAAHTFSRLRRVGQPEPDALTRFKRETEAKVRRLEETILNLDNLLSPADWLDAGDGFPGYGGFRANRPAQRTQDRSHAPISYLNEDEWRQHVALARDLCTRNHLALGFRDHVTNFIGPVQISFVMRGQDPGASTGGANGAAVDPLVKACMAAWDQWCELNEWGQGEEDREEECRRRLLVEGEATLRFFQGDESCYGLPYVRHVEPELIRTPSGHSTLTRYGWGVITAEGDDEREEGLWLCDPQNAADGREVKVTEYVRVKAEVDRTIKRGLSGFFPVGEQLRKVLGLLDNMAHVAKLQAAIAWWEQYPTATADQVMNQVRMGADYTRPKLATGSAGSSTDVTSYEAGTVVRTEGGREVKPGPVATGVEGFAKVESMVLRSVGFRWGCPSYFSGESDASFASVLVTGSPFVRITESKQERVKAFACRVAARVIEFCERSGRLPRGTAQKVKAVGTCKPVVIADEEKKARTFLSLYAQNCADPVQFIRETGADPEQVAANIKDWQQRFGPPPGVPPGGPGDPFGGPPGPTDPTPAPPGSAGGDGSSPNDAPFGDGPTQESLDDTELADGVAAAAMEWLGVPVEEHVTEARRDGEVWQTNGRWFTLKNGRPVRTKAPGGAAPAAKRHPSRIDGTTYGNRDDRDSDDKHFARKAKLAQRAASDVEDVRSALAKAIGDKRANDRNINQLRGKLDQADAKVADLQKRAKDAAALVRANQWADAAATKHAAKVAAHFGIGEKQARMILSQAIRTLAARALEGKSSSGVLRGPDGKELRIGVAKREGLERIAEGAPGPPPRPGLVWKDETSRWVRKDTGEEHSPDAQADQAARDEAANDLDSHDGSQPAEYHTSHEDYTADLGHSTPDEITDRFREHFKQMLAEKDDYAKKAADYAGAGEAFTTAYQEKRADLVEAGETYKDALGELAGSYDAAREIKDEIDLLRSATLDVEDYGRPVKKPTDPAKLPKWEKAQAEFLANKSAAIAKAKEARAAEIAELKKKLEEPRARYREADKAAMAAHKDLTGANAKLVALVAKLHAEPARESVGWRLGGAVREAAPGPAPRPGLQWKDDSHRWIRPETGEEHEPVADRSADHAAAGVALDTHPGADAGATLVQQRAHAAIRDAHQILGITAADVAAAHAPAPPGKERAALARALDLYGDTAPESLHVLDVRRKTGSGALGDSARLIDAAEQHARQIQPHAAAAVAAQLIAVAATLPAGSRDDLPAKTVASALVVDPADLPAGMGGALTALAEKSSGPESFGLTGGVSLVSTSTGPAGRVWRQLVNDGAITLLTARESALQLWTASKAPVQVAVSDVPPEATGRARPGEGGPSADSVPQYKRLTRSTYLRFDPNAASTESHTLVSADKVPEVIGIPSWLVQGAAPPKGSGYGRESVAREGFTGVDSHNHHWVDGHQVKAPAAGQTGPATPATAGPPSGAELESAKLGKTLHPNVQIRHTDKGDWVVKGRNGKLADVQNEAAVSSIARRLGLNVPQVHHAKMYGQDQAVVELVKGKSLNGMSEGERKAALAKVLRGDIEKHAIFDYLIGSGDPNHGNYMIADDGKFTAIDKEQSLRNGTNPVGDKASYRIPFFLADADPNIKTAGEYAFSPESVKEMAAAGVQVAEKLKAMGRAKDAVGVERRAAVLGQLAASGKPVTALAIAQAGDHHDQANPPKRGFFGKLFGG